MKLDNFGKKLKFEESGESRLKKEIDIFRNIVDTLEKCWNRSNELYSGFGVGLIEYEEDFFIVIEDLILLKYGPWKSQIILWYVYGRFDEDKNVINLILEDEGKENKEIKLNNSLDLWNLLEELDKKNK